ncbi:P-loop containing nucleoside triphosphate hydrolase protein [Leucosporidium creatinivorum]|uniref:RNA helicase n=1 Tax=Leucosporidium creatinivorum TaxID=106004 RepID=A0A1Y2G557_9BASI|nr:P-loop containing nucleoside triphosphate hydrolase protein [Leucosporidium creatinivorum]
MVRDLRRTPCRDLVGSSFCAQGLSCPYNHSIPHCEACERYFESNQNLEAHTAGQVHRKQLARATVRRVPVNSTQCECGTIVQAIDQVRHLTTLRHRRFAQSKRYKAAQAYGEAPKWGVSITPSAIDFGHVELSMLTSPGTVLETSMTIKTEATLCYLVGVALHSAASKRSFVVDPIANDSYLSPNSSHTLKIQFHPRQTLGSFSDFLTLTLAIGTGDDHRTFSIQRTISAKVGVQADIDALGPKTPYVHVPKSAARPRARDRNTIRGPQMKDGPRIPWVKKLPPYKVPAIVRAALHGYDIKQQIRRADEHLIPIKLSYEEYGDWWSKLLYIEQVQEEIDVRRYDLEAVKLDRHNHILYYLAVPGLAEGRPSVMKGDSIKVQKSGSGERWFEGIVYVVREREVGLRFAPRFGSTYSAHAEYDVQFTVPRIPARRMQQALASALPREELLFPTLQPVDGAPSMANAPSMFNGTESHAFLNTAILRNSQQTLAVRCILNRTHGQYPFILFGPPGTGKTVTIIEACRQLLEFRGATLLLAAPSNSACDLLALKLIEGGLNKHELFRLMATSRDPKTIPHRLLPFCHVEEDSFAVPPLQKLRQFRVVVTTCISGSILEGVGLGRGTFSHIFIDEAGQALEPEALLPIILADANTSVILAGDPKQLGPITRSPVASAFNYHTSLLERLMSIPSYTSTESRGTLYVKLLDNYRSHAQILTYPNAEFYQNELIVKAPLTTTHRLENWAGWPTKGFPILFHAVQGRDDREGTSPSFFNVTEVSQVKRYVESLRESRRLTNNDIGVISPYAAQVRSLRRSINAEGIMVGSTEQFQGQERSVIIISTVRSNKEYLEVDKRFSLGFLSNPKRFNVAITRAQAGLIIVGDPEILALDPLWRRFLIFIHDNGGWAGQKWDPTPFADPKYDPAKAARREMDRLAAEMERLQMEDGALEELEDGGGMRAAEVGWHREE